MRRWLLALALAASAAHAQDGAGPAIGEPAPVFEAVTLDRDTLRLADYRGRHVLLEFWGTWCGPCIVSAPHLAALYKRYPRDRFAIIGVALDQADDVRQFAKTHGHTWPQIVEPNRNGRPVTDLYGVRGYPTTFLIDPGGVVVYRHDGYSEAVVALLAEVLGGAEGE